MRQLIVFLILLPLGLGADAKAEPHFSAEAGAKITATVILQRESSRSGRKLAQAQDDTEPLIITPQPPSPATMIASDVASYGNGLTLGEAVQKTIRYSPTLHAASFEVEAKAGEAFQAGLRPNPELFGSVQNIGESGQEATLELSQLIELGGKRLKRLRAARLDISVAEWDYEAARLRVITNTVQIFADVLASQSRIKVLTELTEVAQKLQSAVGQRIEAGAAHAVEKPRSEIELARAQAELDAERALLNVAKRRLANNWGSPNADFGFVEGELSLTIHFPSPEQLMIYLDANPDVARWAEEMTRRRAVYDLARATRIPNIRLGAGVRNIEDLDETGAVVSLSVPLPFFDRNQGNIAAAQARVLQGEREGYSAKIEVQGEFLEAYARLVAAAEKLKGLEKQVLPTAREVYSGTMELYTVGKFDLLSVLDAQRTLFTTRLEIINARAEFYKAKVQIEALIGRALVDV